jgi:hypothetical protein
VTLVLRRRTIEKNTGRILENENEVVNILKKGNMMKLNIVDLAEMSFLEQIKLMRRTNVLVGVHGAGLTHIMYTADESVLVEVHPSYRMDRHFRHLARLNGKDYLPLRSNTRETCQGTSDNVHVPLSEFNKAMDGALRLARNFDDGVSECGLVCPGAILAMDSKLDKFYPPGVTKATPPDLRFPCDGSGFAPVTETTDQFQFEPARLEPPFLPSVPPPDGLFEAPLPPPNQHEMELARSNVEKLLKQLATESLPSSI